MRFPAERLAPGLCAPNSGAWIGSRRLDRLPGGWVHARGGRLPGCGVQRSGRKSPTRPVDFPLNDPFTGLNLQARVQGRSRGRSVAGSGSRPEFGQGNKPRFPVEAADVPDKKLSQGAGAREAFGSAGRSGCRAGSGSVSEMRFT